MQVKGTEFHITQGRDGLVYTNFANKDLWLTVDQNNQDAIDASNEMLATLRIQRKLESREVIDKFNQLRPRIVAGVLLPEGQVADTNSMDKSLLMSTLMAFMSEFHFDPNFRFINTLAWANQRGEAKEYVRNYFAMIDSPYVNSITEKMESREFKQILSDLIQCAPTKVINKRFKVYYGSQGTGKTTKAIDEAGDCMVCHSALLPQDLMEDFKFVDGKPEFEPSALQKAMVNGTKIVLDEINLLPFESLRFLQSILDGKTEFEYKGKTIQIAEGFEVIGTMNLVVNGCTYALPEPLVDRASELREFKLTAQDLVAALD